MMSAAPDMMGERFGRLVVVGRAPGRGHAHHAAWFCLCDCGETRIVAGTNLRRGQTRSCGCLQRDRTAAANTTHGQAGSRTWTAWFSAKQRCFNPKHKAFPDYGGRGITMCGAWRDSFEVFLADMGEAPLGLTLERIDNDDGYWPGNCKWATWSEQRRNQRPRKAA